LVALKIQGHPSLQRLLDADLIDGLLHLPVTAIAALDGVGSRGQ
jgi:hypothetical protein